MRTRAVLVAIIALGALMSAGGGALALSGSADQGSAGQAGYPQAPQGEIVLGEEELPSTTGEGDTVEELAPTFEEIQSGTPSETQPPAQEGALGEERELAFTGLAALPLLLAGVVLIVAGLLLSRRARGRPA
jgi:hypothetical protein